MILGKEKKLTILKLYIFDVTHVSIFVFIFYIILSSRR